MVLGWYYHLLVDHPMADQRTRLPIDSEKITINLGVVDLGQIDLLVQEGFYSNRTDLIRTAIRNQLVIHADVVRESVARRTLVLGLQDYLRPKPSSRSPYSACCRQAHR